MLLFFENLFIFLVVVSSFNVLMVVNPVQSLLWLVLTFALSSFLFMIFGVELMSVVMFMVYMGAIAVLFLFVIMMLNVKIMELRVFYLSYISIGIVVVSFFFVEMLLSLLFEIGSNSYNFYDYSLSWFNLLNFSGNLFAVGSIIFNYYFFIFLLLSMILFIAMISSIVLLVDWDHNSFSNIIFTDSFYILRKKLSFLK